VGGEAALLLMIVVMIGFGARSCSLPLYDEKFFALVERCGLPYDTNGEILLVCPYELCLAIAYAHHANQLDAPGQSCCCSIEQRSQSPHID